MVFEGESRTILKQFANREVTWKEESTGLIFDATPFDVLSAEGDFNKEFQIVLATSIGDFFHLIGVPHDQMDISEKEKIYDEFGWTMDCYEGYEAGVIEFIVSEPKWLGGRMIFEIRPNIDPCSAFTVCNGCYNCDGEYKCENCLTL